jgi:hypothetical protein
VKPDHNRVAGGDHPGHAGHLLKTALVAVANFAGFLVSWLDCILVVGTGSIRTGAGQDFALGSKDR